VGIELAQPPMERRKRAWHGSDRARKELTVGKEDS